jgi:predicted metal-dependent enzyme (double-stranded beta helix superfamily)
MSSPHPSPVHPALAALAGAARRQDFEEVENALVVALKRREWLRPEHRVGDPTGYMRHVLYVDPDDAFVMTAITWLPGQVSSRHGHNVWCLYGVAEGELTEESFPGKSTVLLKAGDMARPDLDGKAVHQVANRGRQAVVSLHLYGISAARLTTGINRPA